MSYPSWSEDRRITEPSPLRAWYKLCEEFPVMRLDLEAKWNYFACWRAARVRG